MKINYKTFTTSALLTGMILVAPIASFAEAHGKPNDKKDDNKPEKVVFLNADLKVKKDKPATTTPDIVAPVLSSIVIHTGKDKAEIHWKTNEDAESTLFLSTSSPVSMTASSTRKFTEKKFKKNHEVEIKKLKKDTTYYLIVQSKDKAGNTSVSATQTFKTKGAKADDKAPKIEHATVLTSSTTATVGWKTNEPSTSKVFYSSTTPVNLNLGTTPFVENLALTNNHSLTFTGLTASTTYHAVVLSTDDTLNTSTTSEFALTTK